MNRSIRKNTNTPEMVKSPSLMVKLPCCSIASGKRCKTAPPNKVPAERLTRTNKNFSSDFLLNNKAVTPTREKMETITTLTKVYSKTGIFSRRIKQLINITDSQYQ